jgi:Methyltransferase FkbM domain
MMVPIGRDIFEIFHLHKISTYLNTDISLKNEPNDDRSRARTTHDDLCYHGWSKLSMIVRSRSKSLSPRVLANPPWCIGSVSTNRKGASQSSRIGNPILPPWVLLLLGGGIGHWHGQWAKHMIRSAPFWFPSGRVEHSNHPWEDPSVDGGWHTIHVYYGKQDLDPTIRSEDSGHTSHMDTTKERFTNATTDPFDSIAALSAGSPYRAQRRKWFSQARQDELVIGLLRNKTKGYFIDLAANDAVHFSNTFALEKFHDWNGICIEPNPIYWHNLSSYRNCLVVAAVVGAQRMEEVYFRFEAGDHGGIANDGFNNGKRWQRESERRFTVPLLEILQDLAQAPTEIDYLSLDVEGAESFIMQNFPLDQYRIKIITAERLRGPIRQYLKSQGYEFITRITRWGESLWVHNAYRNELDWSVVDQFQFPLL